MAHRKARVDFLLSIIELLITARRNARIASAVLATAIPSVSLSVRLSVRLSVTRRYCIKTRCLQEGVGHLEPTFQREGVVPLPIY